MVAGMTELLVADGSPIRSAEQRQSQAMPLWQVEPRGSITLLHV